MAYRTNAAQRAWEESQKGDEQMSEYTCEGSDHSIACTCSDLGSKGDEQMTHTHDKYGPCDTLDGCAVGPDEQRIEDCGCTHSPCPCEETPCPYYGALCNLCPLHRAAPALLAALEGLVHPDGDVPARASDRPETIAARAAIAAAKGEAKACEECQGEGYGKSADDGFCGPECPRCLGTGVQHD